MKKKIIEQSPLFILALLVLMSLITLALGCSMFNATCQ